jgi:cellobiose-specific phosphotransferase system component IIC
VALTYIIDLIIHRSFPEHTTLKLELQSLSSKSCNHMQVIEFVALLIWMVSVHSCSVVMASVFALLVVAWSQSIRNDQTYKHYAKEYHGLNFKYFLRSLSSPNCKATKC